MEQLDAFVARLDALFAVDEVERDPGFSIFVPMVYDAAGFDWRRTFEPEFVRRFNGLMLRGGPRVNAVFCAAFPSAEVLDEFVRAAAPGDLLFCHHPIDLRSGDPRGEPGAGFVPIAPATLRRLAERELSVYACHAPMDTARGEVGTTVAMVEALGATPEAEFYAYGNGFAGVVCAAAPRSADEWEAELLRTFGVPYLDVAGRAAGVIERIAIVPGGGNSVDAMREAEGLGAQAYVTGEIRSYADNDYGRENRAEIDAYLASGGMWLAGVSHVASEELVMKRQMVPWLAARCAVEAHFIAEPRAWR
ncbi:MAG TPA: Nif3-like dinuclear metal center hexameric protein [Longimicrobium sp.]|jgi:putative NIF3 family GTP cyclohydrolase 1 type 2